MTEQNRRDPPAFAAPADNDVEIEFEDSEPVEVELGEARPAVPDFAEADQQRPAAAPSPAPDAAPPADEQRDDERKISPWPARIVAGVTVLAILAILLAIFLPREKSEVRPQAGPATEDQTAATTPQPAPTPTVQPATPQAVTPAPTPSPDHAPTTPAPQQPQATEQMGTCPTCGGTGTVPCPFPPAMHTSDGRILHPEGIFIPEGDELRDDLTGNVCPFCGGSLKMTCPQCKGAGRVRAGEPAAPSPGDDLLRQMGVDPKALEAWTGQGSGSR